MLEKWRNRVKIPAIHNHDLQTVLHDLGILDKLAAGEISCSICGTPLTLDNLECVYMQGTELKLSCQQAECCKLVLSSTKPTEDK